MIGRIHIKFVLLFLSYFAISCVSKTRREINDINTIIDGNIGKEIKVPQNIQTYKPFTNYINDSSGIFNSKYRIYSYINASCGTCVLDIKGWEKLIFNFDRHDVSVILIFYSDDRFELIKLLCETKKIQNFCYPFFFDERGEFKKLNDFMSKHIHFQTFLTDLNNRILLFGNPVHSDGIKTLYIEELKKLENQTKYELIQ